MDESQKKSRFCCHIDPSGKSCPNTPVWEVWVIAGDFSVSWDTCHEHVADMLTDAQLHEVRRIEGTVELQAENAGDTT